MVLDQLTDPVEQCLAPFLDIIEARIENEAGNLTFIMRLRAAPSTLLNSPDDALMFIWVIDADCNPKTGQAWGSLGADFKITAKINQHSSEGSVNVLGSIPGGGTGTVAITDDTLRVTIETRQIGAPTEFNWCVTSLAFVDGRFGSGNNISAPGSTVVLPTSVVSEMILDQLTDPVEKCLAPFLDIIEARIENEAGNLTFIMRLRAAPSTLLNSPDDALIFLWMIDADRNPNTGQAWGSLGADFKIAAKINQHSSDGSVNVMGSIPGGGTGTVAIVDDTLRVTIRASQIGIPVEFDWCVTSLAYVDGRFGSGNNISAVGSTVVLPNIPPSRIEVFPPILCLSPTGQSTGRLSVRLFDEHGLQLPADRYTVRYRSSDSALATVDATGMVSVRTGPTECDRPVWINAAVDSLESFNQVLIRRIDGPLPLSQRLWSQEHIGLYMPLETNGSDLELFVDQVRAVDVMESVYRFQKELSGVEIYQGGKQYLIVDDGACDNPVPSSTGNPIRLNWKPAGKEPQGADPVDISWVRVFHEMGHNFLTPSATFRQLTTTASSNHNKAFADALATLEALWSRYRLIRCGTDLVQPIRETIERQYARREQECRGRLAAYQANGSNYELLDADALAGILYELHDEFGDKVWFDLFSALLPKQEIFPVEMATPQQQAAWLVAVLSASTDQDLRERFTTQYGFDIDTQIWETVLRVARRRISYRPWQGDISSDLSCDHRVWVEDLERLAEHWMQADCVGPWWCGSSDLDHNGRVGLSDMDILSNEWLRSTCLP